MGTTNAASIFPNERVTVVGVLNVTPDSFSDGGGLMRSVSGEVDVDAVLASAEALTRGGAHVLDVGGESTRPGAEDVDVARELARVLPAIEALARSGDQPISIDSRKADVVDAALGVGATVVNDVSGLRSDPSLAEVVAGSGAVLIVGHMRGTPETMQHRPHYDDVLHEVAAELESSLRFAQRAGVSESRCVVDPGIGFGKRLEDNLRLIAHAGWLRERLGVPVLVGPSRKRFLGSITGDPVAERDVATAAACAVAAFSGADGVRVHDAASAARAVAVGRALRAARRKELM